MRLSSNQGYEEEAERLLVQYEQLSFEESHQHILDLIPEIPATILDIGAGSGKDAASCPSNCLVMNPAHRLAILISLPTRSEFTRATKSSRLRSMSSMVWPSFAA